MKKQKCLRIITLVFSKTGEHIRDLDSCYYNDTSISAMEKAIQKHGKGFNGKTLVNHEIIACHIGCITGDKE